MIAGSGACFKRMSMKEKNDKICKKTEYWTRQSDKRKKGRHEGDFAIKPRQEISEKRR